MPSYWHDSTELKQMWVRLRLFVAWMGKLVFVLGGLMVIYIRKVFSFAQKLGLAGGHELPLGQLGHEDKVAPGVDMLYFAQSKRE